MTKIYTKRLILKLFLLFTIFFTILISLKSIIDQPSIKQVQKQLNDQIKFKFNEIYYTFLENKIDLNNDKKFNENVNKILNNLLENDKENKFWDINPNLNNNNDLPLTIQVPNYDLQDDENFKPKISKFDPRLTIGIYYNFIINSNIQNLIDISVPFHWSDWVDLSILNKFIMPETNLFDNSDVNHEIDQCNELFNISGDSKLIKDSHIKNINNYCKYQPFNLIGFEIFDEPGPQTVENRILIGKSYLLQNAPSPNKLIFLTNNNSYQINIEDKDHNDLSNSLLNNGMIESLELTSINLIDTYSKFQSISAPTATPLTDSLIHIPEENFNIDPSSEINKLLKQNSENLMDKQFLQSLQYSINQQDPIKYFYESKLLNSIPDSWQGEHYDWRFFNGIILGKDEQSIILHRLIKNYLNFARNHGIITWIAHGSLLSWYWNGLAFPWDVDIDVQVPISELYKLGQYYNQSIIIENTFDQNEEFDGFGRYFIDVGSSITHRTKGNGNNAIDARFIDLDTGLYIDITALALTDSNSPEKYRIEENYVEDEDKSKASSSFFRSSPIQKPIKNFQKVNQDLKLYNCRNNHFTSHHEISPIHISIIENQLSYLPKNFINILNNEYNIFAIIKKFHRNFTYLKTLKIWCNTKILKQVSGIKTIDDENLKFKELIKLNSISNSKILELFKSYPQILKEWIITKNFTNLHNDELKILKSNSNYLIEDKNDLNLKKIEKLIELNFKSIGRSLRPDYFMNNLMMMNNKNENEII
ncbi:uncharacterized protein KGF55_001889 [Candida pseudojiufengensis]|uniref:uncharacterized protein n=1 Tax=Candida pseudojiufengensis TaxID=497109 RepID=UPI002224748F|nr:uncharacterized protein KGF55_001889 [Candida pseudojiufengensis]KAI5964819.1 hypothetical protein KGF55_001889 [Candida pseudojiufengensis]